MKYKIVFLMIIIEILILSLLVSEFFAWDINLISFSIGRLNFLTGSSILGTTLNFPQNNLHFLYRTTNNESDLYKLIPKFEQDYDGFIEKLDRATHIKINSDGFRDQEYSIEKPANTSRIIVLGDSVTFGLGLEINETYSKILENKINSKNKKMYEVMNLGVPGYNTLDEVEFFKEVGLKYSPNIVIIGFLSNDVVDSLEIERRAQLLINQKPSTINEYEHNAQVFNSNYEATVDLENELSSNETMFNYYWEKLVEQPLDDLATINKAKNFTVILVPLCCSSMQKENARLSEIAKRYGWYFIDINGELFRYKFTTLTVGKKDPHYNYFANELIASKLYEYMQSKNLIN